MKSNNNKTRLRKDLFYTFDIETTTLITNIADNGDIERNGIIWSGQFYDGSNYNQVRDLTEVIDFLRAIEKREEDLPYKIAIFVHNLSYEFQFIKDFFKWEKVLCTDQRKIISAETKKLCFRCTYFLSNMSLDKFLKFENVPTEYQKTNMDYLKVRYPWTELTADEIKYCSNDVIGLHLAVQNRIADCYNMDINNLPLTSTGYVRKDCRKACAANPSNRMRFYREQLDYDTFVMCHKAFRGGNTHANKMFANKIIEGVASIDITSSYPNELLTKLYPTKFFDLKPFTLKEFNFYLNNYDKWAMLIELSFEDLELINEAATSVPYISISKCEKLFFDKDNKLPEVDNGRLLRCKYCSMIITELDYLIITRQYKFKDVRYSRIKVSKKKPIMKELADQIMVYYRNKTTLKQDEEAIDFNPDIAYQYGKSKNMLNGIYGMHVTNPVKQNWIFNNNIHLPQVAPIPEEQLLEEFYDSFSSFLSYQVGVWVTAYARFSLQEMIDILQNKDDPNKSDLIYVDTDSCKFVNFEDHREDIEKINHIKIELAEKNNAFVDFKGKRYHLGVFSFEGISEKFKTFGAKKYIYGNDDSFKITISGVPKAKGKEEIKKAVSAGKLQSPFDISKGFVFHGIKTTSAYNDYMKVYEYETGEGVVKYASNIALYPTPYTLGLSYDYELLLEHYSGIMEG